MAGPTGTAFASAQTELGIAIETTRGVATAPAFWVPVKNPKYKPDLMLIPDETLQGSMVQVYDEIRGLRYDGHGWNAPPYLDSFPIFARCELGSTDHLGAASGATTLASAAAAGSSTISTVASVASGSWITIGSGGTAETHLTTGVSGAGPYTVTLALPLIYSQPSGAGTTGLTTHQFSLLNNSLTGNQPPSATITDYDGEESRQITGCQLDELTIKGNGTTLVDYVCTWFGNPATTAGAPSPAYSGTQTPAPWTVQASLGGSQVATIIDWEFDFKRGVKPIPALTGTEAYFEYFADVLQAKGKLTFVEQSGSPYLTDFLNGTRIALDLTVTDLEAGATLNIHSSKAQYTTGAIDRSKEWVEVPVDFQLLPTAADALAGGVSPVLITVANSQTAAY